jgi:3-methyladenine DNA glycosylase AlkD
MGFPSRETRILAAMVDNPHQVTEAQADAWVRDFNCWEVCDQVIMKLSEGTRFAWNKAVPWGQSDTDFVKRAGFVMMAWLAARDRMIPDTRFSGFWPELRRGAGDDLCYVRKAVNWALRQIGQTQRIPERRNRDPGAEDFAF